MLGTLQMRPILFALLFALAVLSISIHFNTLANTDKLENETTRLVIDLTIEQDVYRDYLRFVKHRNPLSIRNFKNEFARRDVVDAVILQQAIALSGEKYHFRFSSGFYANRRWVMLQQGLSALAADTVWHFQAKEMEEQVFISSPVLDKNENFAGLYTTEEKVAHLQRYLPHRVSELKAVVASDWQPDIVTLHELGLKNIYMQSSWGAMLSHLFSQQSDILLAPFPANESLAIRTPKGTLLPLTQFKVQLRGSRHFVVSKNHPQGERIFNALQTGLKSMREQGYLQTVYQQAGGLNHQTKNWQVQGKIIL
ncbi:hypothetical protein [Catenovulum sediminis]|uniref:Solute-binding protein family 3/N-terminal domain-containing protein n=1 Tax=Catenovulum sediminis TaxID=1740262 RepID=A0ABV1RDS4_9ALTE|nr:hypothetical protein [Catenovulum sediminis]